MRIELTIDGPCLLNDKDQVLCYLNLDGLLNLSQQIDTPKVPAKTMKYGTSYSDGSGSGIVIGRSDGAGMCSQKLLII